MIEEKTKNVVWDIGWPCDEKNIRSEIYSISAAHCDGTRCKDDKSMSNTYNSEIILHGWVLKFYVSLVILVIGTWISANKSNGSLCFIHLFLLLFLL